MYRRILRCRFISEVLSLPVTYETIFFANCIPNNIFVITIKKCLFKKREEVLCSTRSYIFLMYLPNYVLVFSKLRYTDGLSFKWKILGMPTSLAMVILNASLTKGSKSSIEPLSNVLSFIFITHIMHRSEIY